MPGARLRQPAMADTETPPPDHDLAPTFDAMELNEHLLRGIYGYGFEKPSAVQQRAVKPLLRGGDCIVQAQSGTGKTGTFTIGVLQRLRLGAGAPRHPQAVLLAPTRELAEQTTRVVRAIGTHLPGLHVHMCIGGTSVRQDLDTLRSRSRPVHVVVGTPGRVYDMIERRALHLEDVRVFVLDEADEMLSRGFQEQIHNIFKYLPNDVQVAIFSATMPPDVLDVTDKFMNDPHRVLVKRDELTLEGIRQFYVAVEREEWKLDTLCDLYETITITQAIIYCNTRRKVEWLQQMMKERDFTTSVLHADMTHQERTQTMNDFRNGTSRVLISTDLTARGIDVQQVSLVINYDLPPNIENYLHRIGRGGRFGRKGVAVNFVTHHDQHALRSIESHYATVVEELPRNIADLI